MEQLAIWEGRFLLFLQELRIPFFDQVMNFMSALANRGLLPILACILLLCIKKYRRAGTAAALSLLLEFILVNGILKTAIHRTRPYEIVEGLTCIASMPHDFSFPSGHTGSSFAVAAAMFFTMPRRIGIPAVIAAALIGFSRLYVGVHFPTDVLAGMLIGILTGFAASRITADRKSEGPGDFFGAS